MNKELYIITTSNITNNVILGHVENAKNAGYIPIIVFPNRKYKDNCSSAYIEYETININIFFNVKNYFTYILSIFKYSFEITKYFLYNKKDARNFLAVDFECTIICFLLKFKKVHIITLVNDNFSIRYNLPKFILFFLNSLESFTYKIISNVCIFPDQCRVDLLLFPPSKNKVHIIPNILDDNIGKIKYIGNNDLNIKVLLCGWLEPSRGLELLKDLINNTHQNVIFILTGSGKFLESNFVSNDRVKYLGQLSRIENLKIMSCIDVNMAFYNPNIIINRFALPQKIFDSILVECPILINSEVKMASDIIKFNVGFSYNYYDIRGISNFLNELILDKNCLKKCSENLSVYKTIIPTYSQTKLQSYDLFKNLLKLE